MLGDAVVSRKSSLDNCSEKHQVGKLYDDVVTKLPVVVMYGDESEWDEEEKERCLGDDEAFGFDLDEELAKVR